MPPTKPVEAGKSFLEQVFAKIPETERATLQPVAQALLANETLLTEIGGGVLRQDDYSREINRLKTIETEQKNWWTENQALVEKGRKVGLQPSGANPNPDDPTLTTPTAGLSLADVTKLLDERERMVAPVMAAVTTLALKHSQMFGEVLDTDAVLREAGTKSLSLEAAYQSVHGSRIAEKTQAAEAARIKTLVDAGIQEGLRAERNRPPDSIGGGTGSPLDALQPKAGTGLDVQELVDEYNAILSTQGR